MKPPIHKLLTLSLLGGLLLGAGSCGEDFLDKKPQGEEITPTFFSNEEGASKAINAVYWQLRQWPTHVFAFIGISSVTSDDAEKGSTAGDAPPMGELDNFTFAPTNFFFNDFWNGQYLGISKANEVIERVPEIEMTDSLKNRYIAEAKFLRAYFYFNLVRTFGGVPRIITVPTEQNASVATPRSTPAEIYQLIEQDLGEAIAVLPARYDVANIGRATSGAAKGLLAKVSMYQKKWPEVLRLTNEIMTSGEYNLNTPYQVIFTEAGENSPESVFEVQAAVSQQCSPDEARLGSQYSEVQSPRPQLGWGFNVPTESLANAYEPGDPRREATIIFRSETLPDGFQLAPDAINPRYNQKAYVYQTESRSPCGLGDAGKNIRILRYADVVLMNAEAANELGDGAKAAASLNMVRARARGNQTGVLPDVSFVSQAQMQEAIWRERRVELAMEHERFWDLVRQGRAAQVLQAHGKPFVQGKHELMPLPQQQIDASGGVLIQNPGY
jgi:hypothetical protein